MVLKVPFCFSFFSLYAPAIRYALSFYAEELRHPVLTAFELFQKPMVATLKAANATTYI
jgi:hypothetical protein